MEYIFSITGIFILTALIIGLLFTVRSSWAGALSLPSVTIITGIMYFFVLPLLFVVSGEDSFFGLGLEGLPSAQIAMALYMVGAVFALLLGRKVLQLHPLSPSASERIPNSNAYWAVLAVLALILILKFTLGTLSSSGQKLTDIDSEVTGLGFLNLAYSSLIAMTIYTLIKSRFAPVSVLFLFLVLGIFLIDGFRFRIVILCSAAFLSWCVCRGLKPRLMLVAGSTVIGLVIFNVIAMTRTYGRGIDLSRIEGRSTQELLQAVGGEIGPVFTLSHLTQRESDFLFLEPWFVAIARLVPSAIWPQKPYPDYLLAYPQGFPDPNAIYAGIAGTQHAEFYMQVGWAGLPIMAFGFFWLAIFVIKKLLNLSADARLAGLSIMPGLIGFYAQQRGYTFQIVCEYVFTLAPLFFIHIGGKHQAQQNSKISVKI